MYSFLSLRLIVFWYVLWMSICLAPATFLDLYICIMFGDVTFLSLKQPCYRRSRGFFYIPSLSQPPRWPSTTVFQALGRPRSASAKVPGAGGVGATNLVSRSRQDVLQVLLRSGGTELPWRLREWTGEPGRAGSPEHIRKKKHESYPGSWLVIFCLYGPIPRTYIVWIEFFHARLMWSHVIETKDKVYVINTC